MGRPCWGWGLWGWRGRALRRDPSSQEGHLPIRCLAPAHGGVRPPDAAICSLALLRLRQLEPWDLPSAFPRKRLEGGGDRRGPASDPAAFGHSCSWRGSACFGVGYDPVGCCGTPGQPEQPDSRCLLLHLAFPVTHTLPNTRTEPHTCS